MSDADQRSLMHEGEDWLSWTRRDRVMHAGASLPNSPPAQDYVLERYEATAIIPRDGRAPRDALQFFFADGRHIFDKDGVGKGKSKLWKPLRESLQQDQVLELWVAARSDGTQERLPFPEELFRSIVAFLPNPLVEVLLSPAVYMTRTLNARVAFLRPTLDQLLAKCVASAVSAGAFFCFMMMFAR